MKRKPLAKGVRGLTAAIDARNTCACGKPGEPVTSDIALCIDCTVELGQQILADDLEDIGHSVRKYF